MFESNYKKKEIKNINLGELLPLININDFEKEYYFLRSIKMIIEKITTIEDLRNKCIEDNCYYVIGYYDIITNTYINYDVFKSPIDCIRSLSKYLELMKLPLKDIELRLIGFISEDKILFYGTEEQQKIFVLDPVMYFKDIYKNKEETEENTEEKTK